MGLREKKKEENRNKILSAAREMFAKNGFHQTSISDIIRQTGLARGTFYLYFNSKGEIFSTLAEDLFSEMVDHFKKMRAIVRNKKLPLRKTLQLGLRSVIDTIDNHRDIVKIFFNSPTGIDPDFDERVEKYGRALNHGTQNILLTSGRGIPGIDRNNVRLISYLLYGGIREVIYHWIEDEETDIRDQSGKLIDFYFNAMNMSNQD